MKELLEKIQELIETYVEEKKEAAAETLAHNLCNTCNKGDCEECDERDKIALGDKIDIVGAVDNPIIRFIREDGSVLPVEINRVLFNSNFNDLDKAFMVKWCEEVRNGKL